MSGNSNTIKGVSSVSNGADGFRVTGTGNLFDSNKAYKKHGRRLQRVRLGDRHEVEEQRSNTGNSGSSNENLCYEYKFAVAITNLGGKEGQRQLWRERHRELRVAQDMVAPDGREQGSVR